jgi:uncharacterized delta-60 repeat protein
VGYIDWGNNDFDFALVRYNPDGSLDTSFGPGGSVTTDFNGGYDAGFALAIQPDDKIVVAGTAYNNPSNCKDFALARYNPDGSLDDSFGSRGKVLTNALISDDEINSVVIQPDGKIVAAGTTSNCDPYSNWGSDFALARYNPDGSLDNTFGSGGITITDFKFFDFGSAVALKSDGKIVVTGAIGTPSETCEIVCDIGVASYNPDGSPDSTFGTNGKVTTRFFGFFEWARAVAVQSDGKIIIAGIASDISSCDIALARYNPDGSLDPTFDSDGKVTTDFEGWFDTALALTIQPDGKIIAAGNVSRDIETYSAIVRYNADGSLDTTFGSDGIAYNKFGYSGFSAVALQSDGKIVTTGNTILARYHGKTDKGTFTYDPNGQFETLTAGETAIDTFTYMITDGVLTDTATVTITITGVNEPSLVDARSGQSAITLTTPGNFDSGLTNHYTSFWLDQSFLPVYTKTGDPRGFPEQPEQQVRQNI